MPYLVSRATLDGLTWTRTYSKTFMENIDQNQFQPNQTHDVADDTVAPIDAENRAHHNNDGIVHIMNSREWTDEQKHKLVEIDTQERMRGKNFMRRVKVRWDAEYPAVTRNAQNLIGNARRFRKEGWGRQVEAEIDVHQQTRRRVEQQRTSLEWTMEMKVVLLMLDEEERARGRGFMKRVKDRWDVKYPEYESASWQKLRDNASRFKKDPEIKNLMLVRRRKEVQVAEMATENTPEEEGNGAETDGRNDDEEQEVMDTEIVENVHSDKELTEKDKELEGYFKSELENLNHSTLLHMEQREKLPKVTMSYEIQERANKIMSQYLPSADTIPEITDIVYAMGKAIGYVTGIKPKERNENNRPKKAEGGNRRERKLKAEMKELRQCVAKTGNELHRRKQHRKSTKREKKILKELAEKINGNETTSKNLRIFREQWLDKLRYKKIKLEKFIEKRNRKKDNIMFQRDQKGFFRTLEAVEKLEGEMPKMEKFVEFWGGIWKQNEPTPNMPWMEEVKAELGERVNHVSEFATTDEHMKKEVAKRKNWTAPGIDGIQNFWWKKFEPAQKALRTVFSEIYQNTTMIPEWWPSGRTVLLPKTKNLNDEKNYRPITCLNTSYKILTGLVAKYMRNHAVVNKIWDEGQLGAVEGVLGTVDQLIIDRCIMEEVKQHHRNLAVAFYDYKKAYDKVHHDWMLRVYEWIGIPKSVIKLIKELMSKWKTRLEIWNNGEKMTSRWIKVLCGFLQGDSYSPVGFCISEIPVCILLQHSRGYRMGEPGNRIVKRTHSLFVDDLKIYQESHNALKIVNEVIVQASHDTGACYGVSKCAEIIFKNGKMVRGEGLQVLEERMRTMDPDENQIYKFLGIEQADGIQTKTVFERVKDEVSKRVKMITNTELNDVNLIKAINMKVVPVAAYAMNICKFSVGELKELDQIVKRELRGKNMLGKQASDERLYLKREKGGRGLKSLRDTYKETRLRVACYMAKSTNLWIEAAWRRETNKEENAIVTESVRTMDAVGIRLRFEGRSIRLDDELIDEEREWKPTWQKVKTCLQKAVESKRIKIYKTKKQQSQFYQEQEYECHFWLSQNLHGRKTSSIMTMLEQMVETRTWKVTRGLAQNGRCRVCHERDETVEHLVAGCKVLANSEYLSRHNRALMIMAVAWAKEYELVGDEMVWYKERWERGTVLENERGKLVWDFEFHLRKTTTARRPDLILEDKENKKIWICDMACPQQRNIEAKRLEKLTKYRQLAYETRERRPQHEITVVPLVIGALGGGIKQIMVDMGKIFENKNILKQTICEMQKTVLMDSETTSRKVLSGLIQEMDE